MSIKNSLTAGFLMLLCLFGFGMPLDKFNQGTLLTDWTDDFPLPSKGKFEISGNDIKLSLTGERQCARYKCRIEGLPANKLMFFSFWCSGKNVKSKEGFRAYVRNQKLRYNAAFSPAGTWKWTTGTFDKVLVEGRFKIPADGTLEVVFELRGEQGEIIVSEPMILPEKRNAVKSNSPVSISVLPAEFMKNSMSLLQDMPAIQKINFRANGKIFRKEPVQLSIQHPAFVQIVGLEHRWPSVQNGNIWYPQLKCLEEGETKHLYQIPDEMANALQEKTVLWNNELYLYMQSKAPAGSAGKVHLQVIFEGKILGGYEFTVKSIGELPKNRTAAKKFKTIIGYPLTAESSASEIRRKYVSFWSSLTSHPEAYIPFRLDQMLPEVREDFCKNYVPGIMIAGTNSLPVFRSLKKMPNENYPKLLDDAEKVMYNGKKMLPSIPYVIHDPDHFIWDKALPEEIRIRSLGLTRPVQFVCFDFEPYLLRSGFCEDNRKWFAEWAGLSTVPKTQEILAHYSAQWEKFRRMQNEMIFRKMASSMQKHFPNIEFRYCSDPLSASGSPSSWCGNDPRLSVDAIQVFHNMPYFSGTEYFDLIQTNTKILGKEQFPLIDPSEFAEQFFHKYSPDKVTQNIIATAALNNSGIGFWHKDCFDGAYLMGIAKGFSAVSEVEEILGTPNICSGLKVLPQNCLLRNINDKSEAKLEIPNLSDKLRFTFHKKGRSAVIVVLNYNEDNAVIAKCIIPQMQPGKYQVFDTLSGKHYGTFSHAELSNGILISVPKQLAAVLKITPAEKSVPAALSQENLQKQIQNAVALLKKDQKMFQNLQSGDMEIRWDTHANNGKTIIRLSSGIASAEIEPVSGVILSLKKTNGNAFNLQSFGELILEGVRLEKTPKYKLVSSKIENDAASLEFSTLLRAEDSTDPQGFPLDGLKITKKYLLKNNRLDYTIQLENCSAKNAPVTVQCRIRSSMSPADVKEIASQGGTQLLLRPGHTITLPWAKRAKSAVWDTDTIHFPDMMYTVSEEITAAYFWRSAEILTAEPLTGKIQIPSKGCIKIGVSILLPDEKRK